MTVCARRLRAALAPLPLLLALAVAASLVASLLTLADEARDVLRALDALDVCCEEDDLLLEAPARITAAHLGSGPGIPAEATDAIVANRAELTELEARNVVVAATPTNKPSCTATTPGIALAGPRSTDRSFAP